MKYFNSFLSFIYFNIIIKFNIISLFYIIIILILFYFIFNLFYNSNLINEKNKIKQNNLQNKTKSSSSSSSFKQNSIDDGILLEKKLKPMYNKISNTVGKSFRWLKTNATNKFLSNRATRGDGLNSIFSNLSQSNYLSPNISITNIRSEILDKNQSLAFDSLFLWGIFEGADISILNELCSNGTTINMKAGDIIFNENDSPSDTLYVIQSGSCEILFQLNDGSKEVIHILETGDVLASVADVISWITRRPVSRGVSARCISDCVLVAIPSPRDEKDRYQSRLHTVTFSRIVRMLLIRFHRTTITTSLFYLGLAQHFLPSFPKVDIPIGLQNLLKLSTTTDLNSISCHRECINYVREAIGTLFGIPSSEVDLPYLKSFTSMPNLNRQSSTNIQRTMSFSSCENLDEIVRVGQFNSNDNNINININSDQVNNTINNQNSNEIGFRQRTGIYKLLQGQSILDIDPIPKLYLIISGSIQIQSSHSRINQRNRSQSLSSQVPSSTNLKHKNSLSQNTLSQLSYLSPTETVSTILTSGDVIGHIAMLLGSSSEWYGRKDEDSSTLISTIALEDTWLIRIPMECFDKTISSRPDIIFDLSARMMGKLPPIIRLFDFCTKWMTLQGGEDIVSRGQPSTGELYIILCGRLRVLLEDSDQDTSISSSSYKSDNIDNQSQFDTKVASGPDWILNRGTLIGDTQLLTGEPFTHTVRAIRRTALSRIPLGLLDFIIHQYPSVMTSIIRNVSNKQSRFMKLNAIGRSSSLLYENGISKTMMFAPISSSVPLDLVCSSLKQCLEKCTQKVLLVTSSDAANIFGGILGGLSEYELILTVGSWMHQIEMDYDIVMYQADWHHSSWNKLCASQCDEILLIANALDLPKIGSSEEYIHAESPMIPKTLIMLHTNSANQYPVNTRKWIENRKGVQRHVHVRLYPNDESFDPTDIRSDLSRLARILTDTAVGLVLGGGGARGMSHLGVIQALEENGIPIDMIGGTSIGSFIGGLYACEQTIEKVDPIAQSWAEKGASLWFYFLDLTFPITSYFNGYNFSAAIRSIFDQKKIEDFWINYFCVTTDLTIHDERIHVNGTASRYIRASMSLANFLPPVCDVNPETNQVHYLVDGGYVNTVPVDIMKNKFGAKIVIAIDVSGEWSLTATHNYGDNLSGASVLLSQWNPFIKAPNVPSMADIATQIAFVSACRQIRRVRGIADLYIIPPVDKYSVLDFQKCHELRQIGLDYGREVIKTWLNSLTIEEKKRLSWLS